MAAAGYENEDQALHEAVHAVGMELCPQLGVAIPVGKDSLSMRTHWQEKGTDMEVASPVTLNVSAFVPVDDVRVLRTPQLQGSDSALVVVALSQKRRLGGSAFAQVYGQCGEESTDVDDPTLLKSLIEFCQELLAKNHILSIHDVADGGIFAAVVEMCIAGRIGAIVWCSEDPLAEFLNEEVAVVIEVSTSDVSEVIERSESTEPVGMADWNDVHRQSRSD